MYRIDIAFPVRVTVTIYTDAPPNVSALAEWLQTHPPSILVSWVEDAGQGAPGVLEHPNLGEWLRDWERG